MTPKMVSMCLVEGVAGSNGVGEVGWCLSRS
jgi:hypothetical protein